MKLILYLRVKAAKKAKSFYEDFVPNKLNPLADVHATSNTKKLISRSVNRELNAKIALSCD